MSAHFGRKLRARQDADPVLEQSREVAPIVGHNEPCAGRAGDLGDVSIVDSPAREPILGRRCQEALSVCGGKLGNFEAAKYLVVE